MPLRLPRVRVTAARQGWIYEIRQRDEITTFESRPAEAIEALWAAVSRGAIGGLTGQVSHAQEAPVCGREVGGEQDAEIPR